MISIPTYNPDLCYAAIRCPNLPRYRLALFRFQKKQLCFYRQLDNGFAVIFSKSQNTDRSKCILNLFPPFRDECFFGSNKTSSVKKGFWLVRRPTLGVLLPVCRCRRPGIGPSSSRHPAAGVQAVRAGCLFGFRRPCARGFGTYK